MSLALLVAGVSAGTGETWNQVTSSAAFSPRGGHTSLVFNNSVWVIGGGVPYDFMNDTWSSSDGNIWHLVNGSAAFLARGGHTSLVWYDKMWVIGGTTWNATSHSPVQLNDVWYSSDGRKWTKAVQLAAFPARDGHASVAFNGYMWVIGGYHPGINPSPQVNDVWYGNGTYWVQATGSAAFPARDSHSSLVFQGKMWVIGGHYYKDKKDFLLNDTWYSSDGITWTKATDSAAFPARRDHTSLVFDNKMWVIGGNDGSIDLSDVWYSSDGIAWTRATGKTAFLERSHHTSLVFDTKMWVIGGLNTLEGMTALHDVWNSALNPQQLFVIKAVYGPHGTIVPGNIAVPAGNDQTFTCIPDPGYMVGMVYVDGVAVGFNPVYTFHNVQASHEINATFIPSIHKQVRTITSIAGKGGSISPGNLVKVPDAADQKFTVIPDAGYEVKLVVVDGKPIQLQPDNTYTFEDVQANHVIYVTFQAARIFFNMSDSVMHFTDAAAVKRYQDYTAEKVYHGIIFPILPEKRNLLGHIDYIPQERDQGKIGNCWVWAATAALEAEHDIQNGVKQRLSIQFFDSLFGSVKYWAGDGGDSASFVQFYNNTKYAIPWLNYNADYQDGINAAFCNQNRKAWVNSADIETAPRYGIDNITVEKIQTVDVNQATAIRNIKTAINNNHPVILSINFHDDKALKNFSDFWYYKGESESFDMKDLYINGTKNRQSHALLCVGYDGDDWIILNSWNIGYLTGTGPDGKPLTIYVNRPNNLFRMKMAFNYSYQWECDYACYPACNCAYHLTEWEVIKVNFTEKPPLRPSLVLDPNSVPHIAYFTQSGALKYMSPKTMRGSGAQGLNQYTLWDGTVAVNAGKGSKYCSLAFDTTGTPYISYADEKTGELKVAFSSSSQPGNTWTTETVVRTVDGVGQNSLVVTSTGPKISYYDYSTRSLNYASKIGNKWYTQLVDKDSDVGGWNSLQINWLGLPCISYTDYSRAALRYAQASSTNEIYLRWSITKVDGGEIEDKIWRPGGYVGKYTSLALASRGRGNPWISYYDEGKHILKYATRTGSLWTPRQVYPAEAPTRGIGSYSSLAMEGGKYPYISCYDDELGDLFFAAPLNVTQQARVDAINDKGRYTSIVLTPTDIPCVAYYDVTNQSVRFARRPQSTWYVTTVGQ